MIKIKSLTPAQKKRSVTVLGFFDGVHKGHEMLIAAAKNKAENIGAMTAVFTFSDLPTKQASGERIFTESERESVFASLGVDRVYTADFESVRNMDAKTFVNEVLVNEIHTRVAFCGENFKFGKGAAYGFSDLKESMECFGGEAFFISELSFGERKISTSVIKNLISEGDISLANSLLCCDFFIESEVERGRGVGKALGFPTLNQKIGNGKIKPKSGVYKSRVLCEKNEYSAITNIGSCPTFREREIHAESFVLDKDVDFYGKNVRVYLEEFVRDEIKFESAELLARQIKKDIEYIRGK